MNKDTSVQEVEAQFYAHYTPPNLFPSRRVSSPQKRPSLPRRPSIAATTVSQPQLVSDVMRRVRSNTAKRTFRNTRSNSTHGLPSKAFPPS